jgi:hypothetical protein
MFAVDAVSMNTIQQKVTTHTERIIIVMVFYQIDGIDSKDG